MGKLYWGNNLTILREHIASDAIDMISLDPPFNSSRNYNVLFKKPALLRHIRADPLRDSIK